MKKLGRRLTDSISVQTWPRSSHGAIDRFPENKGRRVIRLPRLEMELFQYCFRSSTLDRAIEPLARCLLDQSPRCLDPRYSDDRWTMMLYEFLEECIIEG